MGGLRIWRGLRSSATLLILLISSECFTKSHISLPPFSGYRVHAGSVSPVRHRNGDHHFNSTFAHSDDMPHRGRGRGRDSGKFNESPPRFSRGRGGARPLGRGSAGHVVRSGPFRGETTGKSNPNVQPREGDWYCSDPA
uniref:Secreted protein n=1 Tax=Kalanchoe fedtschenkoi TaxID=63787 RepID=A0A7N0V8A0_KALFE